MNRLGFPNKRERVRLFGACAIRAALAASDVVHCVLTKLPMDRATNHNRFSGGGANNLAVIVVVSMDVP
jgi:hypothetical protein